MARSFILATGQIPRQSLYSSRGEVMAGSEGVDRETAQTFIRQCEREEREDFGRVVTRYDFHPGAES